MIIRELDIVGVAVREAKAQPPLVVDPDAHLPGAVALRRLEPVAGRNAQKPKIDGGVDLLEFHPRPAGGIGGNALDGDALEQGLGPPIGESPDHG